MQGDTAEKIVRTAHGLIVNLGYSGFSYADVSDAVQIRKASIHHHFPTKADLVVAVLRQHRERMVQGTRTLDQKFADPLARLEGYVQHWETCIRGKREPFCIAALLAAELPSLPAEVHDEVRQHFDALSSWIRRTLQEGIDKRKIRLQGTAEDEAQAFMAAVHGAMLSARATGTPAVFHTITAHALQRLSAR